MTSDERNRLVKLLRAAEAPPAAAEPITALVDLIAADPARAPTTIVEAGSILERHVADAFDGLAVPGVRAARRLLDLGSGAGFPGLVLAAVLPDARVVLLESAARKCAFLRDAVTAMGAANVEVVHARVEEHVPDPPPDVVTARAVAPLTTLIEYAAPVLPVGGRLVAWKGLRDGAEEADGAAAAIATGMELVEVLAVPPRALATGHHLHVFAKVADTPARFPRRPGMARKRPLGAVADG